MKKCLVCNKILVRSSKSTDKEWRKKRFCSVPCVNQYYRESGIYRGSNNILWKGGVIYKNGYRYIMYFGKRMLLHRHLMEQHLGRRLEKKEIVHHINGNRLDNRIKNLKIISSKSEHNHIHFPKGTKIGINLTR